MARIFQVDAVSVSIEKTNPPTLLVHAAGQVGTPGWKHLDLVPMEQQLSPDGILDLEFVGEPPQGPVPQVVTGVSADYLRTDDVERIVGVLVHARSNSLSGFVNATNPGGPTTGVPKLSAAAAFHPPTTLAVGEEGGGSFTSFSIGEEGPHTLAAQFAESPPLTPIVEKMAVSAGEKIAIHLGESFPPGSPEKLPVLETNPVTDLHLGGGKMPGSGGEGGPGPAPANPMFFSPFGVK